MNVIDSSAWLEYFAKTENSKSFKKPIEQIGKLLVPTITMFEVYKTVLRQKDKRFADIAIALMRQGLTIDLKEDIALHAALISHEKKIPIADSIIYATALKHNATLWTQDADFKGLENVKYFPKKV